MSRRDLEFCRAQYPQPVFAFQLLEARNAAYAPERPSKRLPWDLAEASLDVVRALSVWVEPRGGIHRCRRA